MKIIQLPKGGGKTTELLVWLLEGHAKGISRVLIVNNQLRSTELQKRLQELYQKSGQQKYINDAANRIYTATSTQRLGYNHFRDCEIAVDDADAVLSWVLFKNDRPISIISVTGSEPGMGEAENNPQD